MDFIVLLVRIALAAMFLVAAVGKWRDAEGTRQAVGEFGVPQPVVPAAALALPVAELATAGLLLAGPTSFWGGIAALALLLTFSLGVMYNLIRGRAPDCHCFGQLHSEPVSWRTVARNSLLVLLTVLILVQGPRDRDAQAVQWIRDLTTSQQIELGVGSALFLAALAQLWALLWLYRQNREILARLDPAGGAGRAFAPTSSEAGAPQAHGLPPGTEAPAFELPGLDGVKTTLDDLLAPGKALLLLFVSPTCGPCNVVLPEIARWQTDHDDLVSIALISRGDAAQNEKKRLDHGLKTVLLQDDNEVDEQYRVPGTPGAVLIRPDGTIGSPATAGIDGVRWLLDRVLTLLRPSIVPLRAALDGYGLDHGTSPTAASGPQAPALRLPERSGRLVDLHDFLGSRTMLLFWNTACGFCRHMLTDLQVWEADPPADAPFVVVIAAGREGDVLALPLNSPVLMDPDWVGAEAFNVDATPTGIILNEDGTVGERATGATHIFGLLGTPEARRSMDAV